MKRSMLIATVFIVLLAGISFAAVTVPPVIDLPGTQPREVTTLESPDKCDNCHGGYNASIEPAFTWRGSMMANAGRDPIFWATLSIAEQDFDGAGDLCIRCHSTGGWMAGRSTPTDGSGLAAGDSDGVECDLCHKVTNPNNSEHMGAQNLFFTAYDPYVPSEAFLGSGMYSLWAGNEKLGPYTDAQARHQFMQSQFHRSVDFCGTCHDVSNSAVGHFAPNFGAQPGAETNVITNGPRVHPGPDHILGTNQAYVALNNPPYRYGIVERTFSEFKSAEIGKTLVSDYLTLPSDLQAGALQAGYESALIAGKGGNYADGTDRYYSCQTCHMRPVTGPGCNKQGVTSRKDLPLHDQTGGNYWMPEAIKYLDSRGKLRLGGGLTATQIAALDAGALRAKKQLSEAVSLKVNGNTLTLTNLTGHKVITGYPEGRRMWLRMTWYDAEGNIWRKDGEYGPVASITFNGTQYWVNSLFNPLDPNTKVYEAHYGMTQGWAALLVSLGYDPDMALSYDRYTGNVDATIGQLASGALGPNHETFHFVLNNTVVNDNRIPPYGMSYDIAMERNALPVPDTQYGNPGSGGTYDYHDYLTLNPPANAVYATIELLYQPTSWEYIQFLWLNNNKGNAFLANEGDYMLEAWLATGMAEPYVMASATWGTEPQPQVMDIYTDSLVTYLVDRKGNEIAASTFNVRDTVTIKAHVVEPGDPLSLPVEGAQVFMEIRNSGGALVTSLQGFSDATGTAILNWKTGRNDAGNYTATVTDIIKSGYQHNAGTGQTSISFTVQ